MPLYSIGNNSNLKVVKEVPFKNEKEIQNIVERNLNLLFSLEFVKTEYPVSGLRIDTLAFDQENKSFVIIEYKNVRNLTVIDQGFTYLNTLLNSKEKFVLLYQEHLGKKLTMDYFDWTQSKVIFICPEFTKFQKGAVSLKNIPIELWEISKHENGVIHLEQYVVEEGTESIETITSKGGKFKKVTDEIKVYSEKDLLEGVPEELVDLYEDLKSRIVSLGRVGVFPKKKYIGFKLETNFVDIRPQKSQLKVWVNLKKGELDDPKKLARDMKATEKGTGHWGNGDYEILVTPEVDLDYVMSLVKQSYKKQSQ